ncbi:MAG: hypothetical protein QXP42_06115 [Candidatus Micrarchaeia archaeon]
MAASDLKRLAGIGKKNMQKLVSMGITSLEELALRSPEHDYEGWAFFGKKDEWRRMVLQARALLAKQYISPNIVFVEGSGEEGRRIVALNTTNKLVCKIFVTNILELPESAVDVIVLDRTYVYPKKTGSQASDNYYERIFTAALLRLPEKLREVCKHGSIPVSIDSAQGASEYAHVRFLYGQFEHYLSEIIDKRLGETIEYGKKITLSSLMDYLQGIAGTLYFDSFLALMQQYALSDTPIVSGDSVKMSTGFNLALMGQPGTGKTFATVDLIMGNENDGIPPHGLPGINRYCGGITVAQFIRIAQAYQGKKFNFVVPEFNDWFKYAGMVESLKQAMERKYLKYETVNETIGPYKFDSFFSVNYNTQVYERGYDVTISDPNFNAIEDRMVCRLHRMTKDRFLHILESLETHLLDEAEFSAQNIRDHITLTYAIQTEHQLVKKKFQRKPVLLEKETVHTITEAARIFLSHVEEPNVAFSPRLIKRTIQLCCSLAIPNYFKSGEFLVPDKEALGIALRFFCEEASMRTQEKVEANEVYEEIRKKLIATS